MRGEPLAALAAWFDLLLLNQALAFELNGLNWQRQFDLGCIQVFEDPAMQCIQSIQEFADIRLLG